MIEDGGQNDPDVIQQRNLGKINDVYNIAKSVSFDTKKLDDLKNQYLGNPALNVDAALSGIIADIKKTPAGYNYYRAPELTTIGRFAGEFDKRYVPYVDQLLKEFGSETPYTVAMAMHLAQNYGVKSLSDLEFDTKQLPGGFSTRSNGDGPEITEWAEGAIVPVVKVKSTGQVIPNRFGSYDNGGTNKNGGATYYFKWDLNPDGSPTISADVNPRAGGFFNDFIKPMLPIAALFIPVIGEGVGAYLTAGTTLAANTAVNVALGNAVLNLGVQAAAGNIKNTSDVLKIMGSAGVQYGISELAQLTSIPQSGEALVDAPKLSDAGKIVSNLTNGAIDGRLAEVVGGALQGGLASAASGADPIRGAILGGTARASGVISETIAKATNSQPLGNAVGAAFNTLIASGDLDKAIAAGGISGLNTALNEAITQTARANKLSDLETKALRGAAALSIQTLVAGAPNPQQAIATVFQALKNDYSANGKTWNYASPPASNVVSKDSLNTTAPDGAIDLGSTYFASFPKTLEGLTQYASNGPIISVDFDKVTITQNQGSFFRDLYDSAIDALGLNPDVVNKYTDKLGQDLFNGIAYLSQKLPQQTPSQNKFFQDTVGNLTATVLSGTVDSLAILGTLNGVLKTVNLTTEGGYVDKFVKTVNAISEALLPPAAQAQTNSFAKDWAGVKNFEDIVTVLAKAPFKQPLFVIKQLTSEIGEEFVQGVATGGVGLVARFLGAGVKAAKAAGQGAGVAWEMAESSGAMANDLAKAKAESLQKDLASGKITQSEFNKQVSDARLTGALTGLVIGVAADRLPEVPRLTDKVTSDALTKVVGNSLIALANSGIKEGLPASVTTVASQVLKGEPVDLFAAVKDGSLDTFFAVKTSSAINLGSKLRNSSESILKSSDQTGINADGSLSAAQNDVKSLIKTGGNFSDLTSKVNDSIINSGVLPGVSDIVAKSFVNGTVDKYVYDSLKANNVPEEKINAIIESVDNSILAGGGVDSSVKAVNDIFQKNGIEIASSDLIQKDLFGTSQPQQQAKQYDQRVMELVSQGNPVGDSQRKAQTELGLTPDWVNWKNSQTNSVSTSQTSKANSVSFSVSTNNSVSTTATQDQSVSSESVSVRNSISTSSSQGQSVSNSVSAESVSVNNSVSTATSQDQSVSAGSLSVSNSISTAASQDQSVSNSVSAGSVSVNSSISNATSQSFSNSTSENTKTSVSSNDSWSVSSGVSQSQSVSNQQSQSVSGAGVSISNSTSAPTSVSESTKAQSVVASVSASKNSAETSTSERAASIIASVSQSKDASQSYSLSVSGYSQSSAIDRAEKVSISIAQSKEFSQSVEASGVQRNIDAALSFSTLLSTSKASYDSSFSDYTASVNAKASQSKEASKSLIASVSGYSQSVADSNAEKVSISIAQSKEFSQSVEASGVQRNIDAALSFSTLISTSKASYDSSFSDYTASVNAKASQSKEASQSLVASVSGYSQSSAIDKAEKVSISIAQSKEFSQSVEASGVQRNIDAALSFSTLVSASKSSYNSSFSDYTASVNAKASQSKEASQSVSASASESWASVKASTAASASTKVSESKAFSESVVASQNQSLSAAQASRGVSASISKANAEVSFSLYAASVNTYVSQSTSTSKSLSTSISASTSQSQRDVIISKAAVSASSSQSLSTLQSEAFAQRQSLAASTAASISSSKEISTSLWFASYNASVSKKASIDQSPSLSISESVFRSASVVASRSTSIKNSPSISISASLSNSISASVSSSVSASISSSIKASASVSPSASISQSTTISTSVSVIVTSPLVTTTITTPSGTTTSSVTTTTTTPSVTTTTTTPSVTTTTTDSVTTTPSVTTTTTPSVTVTTSRPVTTTPKPSGTTTNMPSGFQFVNPAASSGSEDSQSGFPDFARAVIGGAPAYKGILSEFFTKVNKPPEVSMSAPKYYEYGNATSIDDILGETQTPKVEEPAFAKGGLSSAFGMLYKSGKMRKDFRQGDAVSGPGDGQSDDIPAMLADGEFVIPADVVAALGNGSTKAGSEQLYKMMHNIRARSRKASPKDLPPKAMSPLEYMKRRK